MCFRENELNGRSENASSQPTSPPSNATSQDRAPSVNQDDQAEDAFEDKLAERFESLELTSLEGQVDDQIVRTFEEVRSLWIIYFCFF